MTDRNLSAEKVKACINEIMGVCLSEQIHCERDGDSENECFYKGARHHLEMFLDHVNSGQLDADCPKCCACGSESGAPPIDWSQCTCSGGTQPVRACPIHGDHGPFSRERCPYCGASKQGGEK